MLDVRSESDYNLFHILDAEHVESALNELIPDLRAKPSNTVFVLMSNDERDATETWKTLVAESVPNVYILEGGINNWLATFADNNFKAAHPHIDADEEHLRYAFDAALGDRYSVSQPSLALLETMTFEEKVKLKAASGPGGGGCG
jgi:rhodanese-related sulfurtransferase